MMNGGLQTAGRRILYMRLARERERAGGRDLIRLPLRAATFTKGEGLFCLALGE